MVPSPCPCDPDVIDAHGALVEADQEHSRATLTAIAAVPPSGVNDRCDVSKLGWQRDGAVDGAVTLVVLEPPQAFTARHATNAGPTRNRLPSRATTTSVMHDFRQLRCDGPLPW
jgi:hypothetical protein